ncbi:MULTISPECIES: squalene/phytoene synthase family protein [unclassified Arthrobacter]|uniref:phytoene/squalene synthase family protein n=1 Tax=unclassified Arthrobacter TaxID=235627 RepID=UPI0024DFE4DA|nr:MULTISPECIES: squalene/phytoene synthase family protein [unclassified Arthrobacter]MCC9144813.1 squalene/phytoene synthase family protein [Arthrobacter sp. zg-Y919]MDK1276039.1 squalene/phytoene synthase family protein [Arthrobacter sp. zg.Y919]WIB02614.1 squalene/phytoene synthase family protein [Arthrobacter sp. zg-Y919]
MAAEQGLPLYNAVARQTSAVLIRSYSTSFGLASRLLDGRTRKQIETIYALVRLADEVVDGVPAAARVPPAEIGTLLDELEADTERALRTGYSVNLVVHAFALTAGEAGIGTELTRPFFASMRADLDQMEHTEDSFNEYVYGSAEVVGLMCLQCFLQGVPLPDDHAKQLREGAQRLGAAFQKVNFLRDLAQDFEALGRSYFPGITVAAFSEADKHRILDGIDADLLVSGAAVARLPANCRAAVVLAQDLFAELARRLRSTPAEELRTTRVRVSNPVKARIAARALLTRKAAVPRTQQPGGGKPGSRFPGSQNERQP